MTALVSAWKAARQRLEAAGVDSPVIDARLLLQAAVGEPRSAIIAEPRRPLTPAQESAFEDFIARRERREPVSRILGRKGFWKIELAVTPQVLSPRADSETVLDVVLPRLPDEPISVLDLGVGSGAILLAMLVERPGDWGVGVDISAGALAVARDNAASLGLGDRAAFVLGDWAAAIAPSSFDVVVCNPPYVASKTIDALQPEVRDHEPRLSLDGGADGLDSYRRLAPRALATLRPGGIFAVEIDPPLRSAVEALLAEQGAGPIEAAADLAGRERVLFGRKKDVGEGAPSG